MFKGLMFAASLLVPLAVFAGTLYVALGIVQPWLVNLDAPLWVAWLVSIAGGLWVGGWAATLAFMLFGTVAAASWMDD